MGIYNMCPAQQRHVNRSPGQLISFTPSSDTAEPMSISMRKGPKLLASGSRHHDEHGSHCKAPSFLDLAVLHLNHHPRQGVICICGLIVSRTRPAHAHVCAKISQASEASSQLNKRRRVGGEWIMIHEIGCPLHFASNCVMALGMSQRTT